MVWTQHQAVAVLVYMKSAFCIQSWDTVLGGEVVYLFFKIFFFSIATLKLVFFASVAVPCGEYCLGSGSLGCWTFLIFTSWNGSMWNWHESDQWTGGSEFGGWERPEVQGYPLETGPLRTSDPHIHWWMLDRSSGRWTQPWELRYQRSWDQWPWPLGLFNLKTWWSLQRTLDFQMWIVKFKCRDLASSALNSACTLLSLHFILEVFCNKLHNLFYSSDVYNSTRCVLDYLSLSLL